MSTILSSVAHGDHGQREAAQPTAEPVRTSASALLAAADIWSTPSVATTQSVPVTPSVPVVQSVPVAQSIQLTRSAPATPSIPAAPSENRAAPPASDQAEAPAAAPPPRARPSELLARAKAACSSAQQAAEGKTEAKSALQPRAAEPAVWPPRKLSLALQGGGTFAAFTWGVLDRLLQEPDLSFDAISGASAGAVNAVLLACGLAEGGRDHARALLAHFWNRIVNGTSFRALMLIGAFSPASTQVSFGSALKLAPFDPLDLNPLRQELRESIDFTALRTAGCPKLLIAATRVRDGRPQIFRNADITADVLLASTCPPLVHDAVEIGDEAFWDGSHSANPPLVRLIQESESADLLVVQAVPARDDAVPTSAAAIDRRLDQIAANAALQAEIAAIEWARDLSTSLHRFRLHRIAADDEIEGLAQQSSAEIDRSLITLLCERGHAAAERWLRQGTEQARPAVPEPWDYIAAALQSFTEPARV
jgi:NTE family protein